MKRFGGHLASGLAARPSQAWPRADRWGEASRQAWDVGSKAVGMRTAISDSCRVY